MQDEVNEKVDALSIKTSKLTAEVLQKAMKAVLAKGKQQLSKAPHGKITMRQLMNCLLYTSLPHNSQKACATLVTQAHKPNYD